MDHRTFLATLPPDVTARLSEKLNAAPLRHLAAHISLILLSGALIALRVPFWPALLPVHGIFLIFLFCLEHEATHKTPFANAQLNEWTGQAIGVLILLPFQWFRYFHLAHHRFTNIPDKDPELLAGAKPTGWAGYIRYVSGLPYWAAMITQIIRSATGGKPAGYIPKRAVPRIRSEARWMLLIYGLAAASLFFSPFLVWVWLVPLVLGQPLLRLFLLAEHGRCPQVGNMFENTRTTFTTKLIRFLTWNMPYHAEHHALPNTPFHRLPQLHALARNHLQVTEDGYVTFSRKFVAGFSRRGPGAPMK